MNPIDLSETDLNTHFDHVVSILSSAVAPASEVGLSVEAAVDPLVAGLVGSGCETAPRTRGNPAPVAPLAEVGSGLWAWLGYREEWNIVFKGGAKRFRFRNLGMTVHFGFKGSEPKPQMFRAEWAGALVSSSGQFSLPAGNAGHPHWQFDAIDSLMAPAVADRAREFIEILRAEHELAEAHDFTPDAVDGGEVRDVICGKSLAGMHFASVAPWWRSSGFHGHAHAPENARQLRDWLHGTLKYVLQELDRV